jgi:hypothetical protein
MSLAVCPSAFIRFAVAMFFIVVAEADGLVSVIETAPEPFDSEVWAAHIVPGQESNTLSAPASRQTIEVAPIAMMEVQSGRGASNRGTSPLPSVSAEPTHMVIRRYLGGRIAMWWEPLHSTASSSSAS